MGETELYNSLWRNYILYRVYGVRVEDDSKVKKLGELLVSPKHRSYF